VARPQRDQSEGVRQITCRGNRRQAIFVDRYDRERFLALLAKVAKKYGWRVIAYCLMTNHVQLVIDVPAFTISRGMQILNGQYAQAFNRRHGYVGHLFERRYDAARVDTEPYSPAVAGYVAPSPSPAGLVLEAVEWRWTSHRAALGKQQPAPFLDIGWTLDRLAHRSELARQGSAELIAAGEHQPDETRPTPPSTESPGPAETRRQERGQAPGQVQRGRDPYD
jgi:REP element-mobilizing transposase RayT